MFTYEIKNSKQIQEQAYVYIEETSSGIFSVTKNRFGGRDAFITSKEVVEALKNGDRVAFLDIHKSIHTNFIPVIYEFHQAKYVQKFKSITVLESDYATAIETLERLGVETFE